MKDFEQIISKINTELNKIYNSVNSVSIVIVPEEKLERFLDDVKILNKKLSELIENEL